MRKRAGEPPDVTAVVAGDGSSIKRRASDRNSTGGGAGPQSVPTGDVPDLGSWIYVTFWQQNKPLQYAGKVQNYRKQTREITHLVVEFPRGTEEDPPIDVPLTGPWELIGAGDPGHFIRPYETSDVAARQALLRDPSWLMSRRQAAARFLSVWVPSARSSLRPLVCLGRRDADEKERRRQRLESDIEQRRESLYNGAWSHDENESVFFEHGAMVTLKSFFKWLSVFAYSKLDPRSRSPAPTIALLRNYAVAYQSVRSAVTAKNIQYQRPPIVSTIGVNKIGSFVKLGDFHRSLVEEGCSHPDHHFHALSS